MLSILIPTYNYNARALVMAFDAQADRSSFDVEIIVGDDASTVELEWLEEVEKMPRVRVLRAEKNLGRARNRNRMADASRGEWLLFVDCDARIESDFSLLTYEQSSTMAPVVCGGLRHPATNPNPEATLRYKYERQADKKRGADIRNHEPYSQLSTFNLLVRRDIFMQIRFDEGCTEYGYEDTLFGKEIEKRGLKILHIDNPIVHIGLERNEIYLRKVEVSLHTLKRMESKLGHFSRVIAFAEQVRRLRLSGLLAFVHRLTSPLVRMNLLSHHPNLLLFQWYKLGYYLSIGRPTPDPSR